ncbi:hypothetical protein [Paracoccus sp. SM22M-07]|uniref:hypothetical protein n=1 Tax=Paracoccus sp. SM22M-07 TaxID=1520813 RepID=UPI00111490B1|nr:hypothetical protein [Paracoccus sp. SM22M-07]
MSPRSMALAAFIQHDCSRHGWSRNAAQIAEDLASRYPAAASWKLTGRHVARILREKNWTDRARSSRTERGADIEQTLHGMADPTELRFSA